MRPVERGAWPESYGVASIFGDYAEAKPHLIERMGSYCSYCGIRLDLGLAVEHVQPKARYAAQALDWTNLLLACDNCNSIKGDQDPPPLTVFWPDTDNTARALMWGAGGQVQVAQGLSIGDQARARATIALTGLDRRPGRQVSAQQVRRASDRRYQVFLEIWDYAKRSQARLQQRDSIELREQIVDTAAARGCWPICSAVFCDDVDMLRRLRLAFPGTADCFDVAERPLPRRGGAI